MIEETAISPHPSIPISLAEVIIASMTEIDILNVQ